MPLTDVEIRKTKPGEKPYKLSDGGWLFLLVNPTGSKLWRLAYRFAGKEKNLSLGGYPELSLKDARTRRDEAKALLSAGTDPGQEKRLNKIANADKAALTFYALSDEYLERRVREGRAAGTLEKNRWLLEMAYPALGKRPIGEIKAAEILAVCRKAEARGHLETAKRLRGTIGAIFRYAISTARAESDPSSALKGALLAPRAKHRAAITDPKALGAFLRAVDEFDGQGTTKAALKILPLVFTRPGELRLAEWPEFDFEKAIWTIPASQTKMRREHQVPLPHRAIHHLRELHTFSGDGKLVFPGLRTNTRPISENTLNAAMRRMGFAQDEVCSQGFRATASTLLNERASFPPTLSNVPLLIKIQTQFAVPMPAGLFGRNAVDLH